MAAPENRLEVSDLVVYNVEERLQTKPVIKRPCRCKSCGIPQRLCKTHGECMPRNSDDRAWDAWERRALRKERRELAIDRGSTYTRYSRGPEILKAVEKLRSRSHS